MLLFSFVCYSDNSALYFICGMLMVIPVDIGLLIYFFCFFFRMHHVATLSLLMLLFYFSFFSAYMGRHMGKPTICIGENKDADQLRGNREADQRLCFRYLDSTIPLLLKSEISRF